MATKIATKRNGNGRGIGGKVNAIRDKWHTKKHPLFQGMKTGSTPLKALGVYMAKHYQFVQIVQPAMGLLYYRGPHDVQLALIDNIAEEEGISAIPGEGHEPHNHNKLIFDFCKAAGLSEKQVRATELSPAWWARSLHYVQCLREEPIGVALAMQSTQEGQQVALNVEVTIPSFIKHYGFKPGSKEIGFFEEHAEADLEHSSRQMALCERYLDDPALQARALRVCEEACRLRWASITEVYREHVLKERDILPPGVAA
jgi:pyrroloquinoline quinone (PQQ) biosynthesis protein C